jgi:hypothetical protein
MATPEYVPIKPMDDVRVYESPPRRPQSWMPVRPGDLVAEQPQGGDFGYQGPDQGYALKLAETMRPRVSLTDGETWSDAMAGCLLVSLKRASLFGRAPMIHDLTVAFTAWGFLDQKAHADLIEARRPLFAGLGHGHHYQEQRHLVGSISEEVLRLSHAEVARRHAEDWRSLLALEPLAPH